MSKKKSSKERFNRCDLKISKFKDVVVKQNFTFPTNDSKVTQIDRDLFFLQDSVGFPNGCLFVGSHQFDIGQLLERKKYRTFGADYALEKYSTINISNDRKTTILYFTDQSWSSSIGDNNIIIVIEQNTVSSYVYTLGFTPCVNGNNILFIKGLLTFIAIEDEKLVLYSLSNGIEIMVNEYKLIELEEKGCGLYCFKI